MFKSNGYKSSTIKRKDLHGVYNLNTFGKYYIPVLETLINYIQRYDNEDLTLADYKKDCGLEEANIILRLKKDVIQDKVKIKSSIMKSRSRFVKNAPIPSILK